MKACLPRKEKKMGKKYEIAVGLSGGVDSAVAAMLLLQQGHKVVGITMKIWDPALNVSIADGHGNACYGPDEEEDIKTCRQLCAQLGMKHIVIDLSKEYSRHIVRYFTDEYLAGRTPNPCVRCNAMMKFGFLIRKARENAVSFDRFATGHYARTVKSGDLCLLKRAVDQKKDQTYFLHAVSPAILSKTMFPLGDFTEA